MDYQLLFNGLLAVLSLAFGWLWNLHREEIKQMREKTHVLSNKVQNLELAQVKQEVNSSHIQEALKDVKDMLSVILTKLDNKQDKR